MNQSNGIISEGFSETIRQVADILREASAIIEATCNTPRAVLPDNMRYPIVDELTGFAGMLEDELKSSEARKQLLVAIQTAARKASENQAPEPVQESFAFNDTVKADMRSVLRRIHLGHYHEDARMHLSNAEMADLAMPFVSKEYDKTSEEQTALVTIYLGYYLNRGIHLTASQMADLALSVADIQPSDLKTLPADMPVNANAGYQQVPVDSEQKEKMRAALRRIYIGRYHELLSQRLSDTSMADIAFPFTLMDYNGTCPELTALKDIYRGRYCSSMNDRLCDTQMAEIARPFAQVRSEELTLTPDELAKRAQGEVAEPETVPEPEPKVTLSRNATVAAALTAFLGEGEFVIWREPFRWFDKNGVLSNHYDGYNLEDLADEFGYEIIANYNDVGIVRDLRK